LTRPGEPLLERRQARERTTRPACFQSLEHEARNLFNFQPHRDTISRKGRGLMEEVAIGSIEKYFGKIGVAAIKITSGELKVGDKIHIKGHSTDFEQTVDSMQVEHLTVETAGPGTDVGIRVKEKVHEKDTVFVVKG
jgi:hypothetical protein